MAVGIDQTGKDRGIVGVNDFCGWADKRSDVVRDGENFALKRGEREGLRLAGIDGIDAGVDDRKIGGLGEGEGGEKDEDGGAESEARQGFSTEN